MVCKFCGNEIDNNSDFCFICGQKVEPEQPESAAEVAANVYTQPESAAPATEAPAAAPAVAVAVADAPEAAPAAPVAAPAAEVKSKKELKREKKAAKKAAAAACPASKAEKFFSFIFVLVGLILYSKAKKKGDEAKAVIILNTFMTGLCVKMGIVIIIMVKKFMLS